MTLDEQQVLGDAERVRRGVTAVLDRLELVKAQREAHGRPGLTQTQRDHVEALHDELQRLHTTLAGEPLSDDDRAFLASVGEQMGWD